MMESKMVECCCSYYENKHRYDGAKETKQQTLKQQPTKINDSLQ